MPPAPAPTTGAPTRVASFALALALVLGLGLALVSLAPHAALAAGATTPPAGDEMLTLPPETSPDASGSGQDDSPPTTNDFLDLERDPSECIGNSNAKPGCGRNPIRSGDRGGWMQWTVFAVMAGGIAFIGWRIAVGLRKNRPGAA